MSMKKTLVSALTTALVVGAASTTFAAANPFEDVPADHWAYDAIAQLAADGVIEGYGDGTYRGDQEITRYEMAQMVARAMAKGGGDKALIDKLAAEFADELNNLGVRVAALEKKVDNVKWNGLVRYEYYNYWNDNKNDISKEEGRIQYFKLRFQPTLTINEHWFGSARLDYNTDADTATNVPGNGNDATYFKVDRIWVQGDYDNLTIKLGKPHFVSSYEGHGGGMVYDTRVAGGYVTVGNKLKLTLGGGRANYGHSNRYVNAKGEHDTTGESVMFAELGGQVNDKFGIGAGFYRVSAEDVYGENGTYTRSYDAGLAGNEKAFGSNNRNIWKVGFDFKFAPKWLFNAAYARSNGDWETKFKQAYTFEFSYNGGRYTDSTKPGSFGAFLAYRHIGAGAVIAPVYDGMCYGSNSQKGVEVGVSYTPLKNVLATLIYFNGKDIGVTDDRKTQQVYGCLDFFF